MLVKKQAESNISLKKIIIYEKKASKVEKLTLPGCRETALSGCTFDALSAKRLL